VKVHVYGDCYNDADTYIAKSFTVSLSDSSEWGRGSILVRKGGLIWHTLQDY
jgi:hypothetical protein